ncbi:MAG: hypothetical protein IPG45_03475 [Deltaproteobacteria bacterium]|nr:hypothetical protein [Deltaproteobacteria bacterium]
MGHRRILLLTLPCFALACEDEVLVRLPEPETQVDELKQKPAALVDILWVVDNSGSMQEEQAALAANFEKFITGLTTCQGSGMANDICDFNTKKCAVSGAPCNPPDYHIGVISTDVRTPTDTGRLRRVGLCVPSSGASPLNGRYDYCTQSSQCTGDAANGFCDVNQSISFVTATTPGASAAFARAVQVGITGSGLETGIRAAALAVGRDTNRATGEWTAAPAENNGFLRPDASLFMIFVSDEEDSSFGEVPYYYRAFETLKGAGNEAQVSVSAIVGDPDVDGETGQTRGGCPAPPMDLTASPGGRYVSLAMYSRGLGSELRVCDDRRLTCPADNTCARPVPGLPGICVPGGQCAVDQDCGNFKCTGDKGCIPCTNARCTADPALFLELLSRNGVFGSICAPDYGVVLGSLGFEAAGLARKFQLTKFPDCAKEVKCCDKDVAEEACTTNARVCVRVNGKVIPNERQTGWVYEPGSNAIFFDGAFVPPTDAAIEVLYKKSGADKALSCETAIR